MFHFDKGPQSPRHIEELVRETPEDQPGVWLEDGFASSTVYWDEIVSYAARRTYSFEENFKIRPPLEHSRAALRGLVENARFQNVRVNPGYVRALGMQP